MLKSQQDQALENAAKAVLEHSHSPYSKFKVAAVVVDDRGQPYAGVNVENASFGLTICAERSAIFSAISAGAKKVSTLLIYTPTLEPTPPCGACRQVIREFSEKARILCVCDSEKIIDTDIDALLPHSFGPLDLE